jgi:O-antigen/teichoic acid export membrane protein
MTVSVRRSLFFSFIDKYATGAISLATIAVAARLLTPAEIGVFVVAMAAVNVVEHFRDFGICNYLVQVREITSEGAQTAFTLSFGFSLVLAALLFALAGLWGRFFGHPELEPIVQFLAAGFLLVPFSSPILALLRREMAFRTIAYINVGAAMANSIATIAFAALGFGSLSLAWAVLIAAASTAVMALACRPKLKIFRPALSEWRSVFSFGGYSSATTLLNMLYDLLPSLAVGRVLGFDAVGVYSSATRLCLLPERWIFGALQQVVLPALSARVRGGDELKGPYLMALGLITVVQWPFLVCLALLADPIVLVLLGAQWMGVAPLVRIIAVAWLAMFPAQLTYPLLVSVGKVKEALTASLVTLPVSAALVVASTFIGLEAVAASALLTAPFQVYVALNFVRRHVPFAWSELAHAVSKSAVVTLCAAAAPAAAVALAGFRFDLSIIEMLTAGTGAIVGWAVGLSVTAHPLLEEIRHVAVAVRDKGADRVAL